MKKNPTPSLNPAELRYRAEKKLRERNLEVAPTSAMDADVQRLVHELEVHQIELTMQNEELKRSQEELETTLNLYAELYAFAPVGYFTLTRDGLIRRVNLTGAKLLGEGLSDLIKRRFGLFVAPQSRETFNEFLEKVFVSENKAACEVLLQKDGFAPFWARVEAVLNFPREQAELCYAIVTDITDYKQAEFQKSALMVLQENAELYRSLFDNMPNGFAYCETILDGDNHLLDFIYRTANNAFEKQTGLRKVIGKKASEVAPNMRETDSELLKIYGRVSQTGKPERVEMFVNSLQKSFRISVFSLRRGYFAVLFDEASARADGIRKIC